MTRPSNLKAHSIVTSGSLDHLVYEDPSAPNAIHDHREPFPRNNLEILLFLVATIIGLRLVEETEAHVIVGLLGGLLLLLLLGLGSSGGTASGGTTSSGTTTTTAGDGGKLGGTLGDQLEKYMC